MQDCPEYSTLSMQNSTIAHPRALEILENRTSTMHLKKEYIARRSARQNLKRERRIASKVLSKLRQQRSTSEKSYEAIRDEAEWFYIEDLGYSVPCLDTFLKHIEDHQRRLDFYERCHEEHLEHLRNRAM